MPGTLISRTVLVMLLLGGRSLLLCQVVGILSGCRLGLVMMLGLVSLISRHIRCAGGILDWLMTAGHMTAGHMTTGHMTAGRVTAGNACITRNLTAAVLVRSRLPGVGVGADFLMTARQATSRIDAGRSIRSIAQVGCWRCGLTVVIAHSARTGSEGSAGNRHIARTLQGRTGAEPA